MNINLFGNKIFAEVIKLKWGNTGLWRALCRDVKRHRDRHTESTPCDNGGRDWSDVSMSQGAPRLPATQMLRERGETHFPLEPSENMQLLIAWCQTFSLQNNDRINFCWVKPLSLWSLVCQPRKLRQCYCLFQIQKLKLGFPRLSGSPGPLFLSRAAHRYSIDFSMGIKPMFSYYAYSFQKKNLFYKGLCEHFHGYQNDFNKILIT